jgi:mono/diheme cytochrome c family protein
VLAVWAVVALGFVPLIWRRPLADAWPGPATFLRIGALLVILPGSILGIVWLARFIAASLSAPPPANPIPASSASIQRGQALYQERCLPCHGPAGLGDGPAALALVPRPANLQVHMLPGVHTDQQIFAWISDGYPNSAMPAFGELLSEEERWHVLNYIRTLVPGAGP